MSRWRRVARGRRPEDRSQALLLESRPPDATRVALVTPLRQLPESQRRGTVKARLSRGRAALMTLLTDEPAEGASHA